MDQRAQDLLRTRLQDARPAGRLPRRGGGRHGPARSEITWVVDPIDGTVNYLYDIPAYAVSVAAVVGDPHTPGAWRPVAGRGGQPRDRRAVPGPRRRRRLAAGAAGPPRAGSSWPTRRRSATPSWAPASATTPRGGSGRRRCCSTCCPRSATSAGSGARPSTSAPSPPGSLDAYFERGLNPWDMAAAWLVLTEAGGRVHRPRRRAAQRPDGGRGGAHAAYRPARGGAPRGRAPGSTRTCSGTRPVPGPPRARSGCGGSGGAVAAELGDAQAVLGGEPSEVLELGLADGGEVVVADSWALRRDWTARVARWVISEWNSVMVHPSLRVSDRRFTSRVGRAGGETLRAQTPGAGPRVAARG